MGRPTIVAFALVALAALTVEPAAAQSAQDLRAGVIRALPVLERSAATFVAERSCMSCHHNALSVMAFRLARRRGFSVDATVLDGVERKTFRELSGPTALEEAIQAVSLSDPTPNQSYLLMAAHAAGIEPTLTTAVYARRMARWQRPDGHWVTSDFRPPHSSSLFTATATAVRVIRDYMPEELTAERDAVISRARQWLSATPPRSTEDASFRVMGLAWAGATGDEIASAVRDLIAQQEPGGGWPQLPSYESDAYSTGEALVALREAGMPVTDDTWQKGLAFLLSTQAPDGTWHVRTRMISPAEVSPPYFATGFPYGKDEFLSYTGSCWAVMALLSALPELPASPSAGGPAAPDAPTPWTRAALFGTADALASLLDAGLDPDSRTERGTTLLMMAAPDPDKIRLLVERKATAKARADSGVDAISIAASYGGASTAVRLLLEAGADTEAPPDIRVRRSPLLLSSMAGDLDTVTLLLSHGASPSVEALSEAVTFNHADVAMALVEAGVEVNVTESSGINLLHWAAITNRPEAIPVLAAAGVPIDAVDDFGFTPLMYAATIDFGDTDTLRALLRAGADRRIRNAEGRTPLEQARRFRHTRLAEALR